MTHDAIPCTICGGSGRESKYALGCKGCGGYGDFARIYKDKNGNAYTLRWNQFVMSMYEGKRVPTICGREIIYKDGDTQVVKKYTTKLWKMLNET